MKMLETTASPSDEETSSSSEEESSSQEKLQTNARNSNSGSQESDYEPGEEESDESGDPLPKSVVPVAGGSSKTSNSKRKKSADNVSENEKGKKRRKSYDLNSNGLHVASSSRSSLKAKGRNGYLPRVWSLKDEITLLNSMFEFRSKEGREVDPSSIKLFCELLKGRLSFAEKPEVNQVSKKIKALKKKYLNRVKSFQDEHDLTMKDLADKVWKRKPSNRKSSKREIPLLKKVLHELDVTDLEEKLNSEEKAVTLEKKLKMQRIDDMKVLLKRLELDKEIIKFNMEEFGKSDV